MFLLTQDTHKTAKPQNQKSYFIYIGPMGKKRRERKIKKEYIKIMKRYF